MNSYIIQKKRERTGFLPTSLQNGSLYNVARLGLEDSITFPRSISCFGWSDDGEFLAACSSTDFKLRIWDMSLRKRRTFATPSKKTANCCKFLPFSNDLIVTAGKDREISLFNVPSGSPCSLATYTGHTGPVRDLAVDYRCPNLLLSVSEDGTARQYDLRSNENKEGTLLVDLRNQRKVLHRATNGIAISTHWSTQSELTNVLIDPSDVNRFVVAGDSIVRVYDRRMVLDGTSKTAVCLRKLSPRCEDDTEGQRHKNSKISGLAFNDDGSLLLVSYLGDVFSIDMKKNPNIESNEDDKQEKKKRKKEKSKRKKEKELKADEKELKTDEKESKAEDKNPEEEINENNNNNNNNTPRDLDNKRKQQDSKMAFEDEGSSAKKIKNTSNPMANQSETNEIIEESSNNEIININSQENDNNLVLPEENNNENNNNNNNNNNNAHETSGSIRAIGDNMEEVGEQEERAFSNLVSLLSNIMNIPSRDNNTTSTSTTTTSTTTSVADTITSDTISLPSTSTTTTSTTTSTTSATTTSTTTTSTTTSTTTASPSLPTANERTTRSQARNRTIQMMPNLDEFFPDIDFSPPSAQPTPQRTNTEPLNDTNNTNNAGAPNRESEADQLRNAIHQRVMSHLIRQSLQNFEAERSQRAQNREPRDPSFVGPVEPPVIERTQSETGSLRTTVTSTSENATTVKTTEKGVNIINDNNIKIEREYLHRYTGHSNIIDSNTVSFFGLNSDYVICASNEGMIVVWDTKSAQIVSLIKSGDVNAFSIKPRPKTLSFASCNNTSEIKVWSPCGSDCTSGIEIDKFIDRNLNDNTVPIQSADSMTINIVQIQPLPVEIPNRRQAEQEGRQPRDREGPECSIQ